MIVQDKKLNKILKDNGDGTTYTEYNYEIEEYPKHPRPYPLLGHSYNNKLPANEGPPIGGTRVRRKNKKHTHKRIIKQARLEK